MRHPLNGSAPLGGAARRFGASPVVQRTFASMVMIVIVATLVLTGYTDRARAGTSDPDATDPGGSLTVEVTDDTTPSPTPTPTPTPSRSTAVVPSPTPVRSTQTSGGSASTPAGTVTVATIADPVAADGALVDAEVIDGVLAISGLTTQAAPSIFMGNGSLTVDFVIRNLSSAAFDSTAKFWVDNAFGGRIADIDGIAVAGLQPDETRRVQVRFEGLGQHILLHANATLTPPTTLDGVTLEPISRNTSLLVPPWFSILLIAVIAILAWLIWWYVRRREPVVHLHPAGGYAQ